MKALLFSDSVAQGNQTATYLRGKMDVDIAVPSELKEKFASSGSGKIYSLTGTLNAGNVGEKISEIFQTGYDYAFVDSTILGREVAGYLAIALGSKCVAEINSFEIAEGKARTRRYFYGGKTVLEDESSAKLFTVAPGISEASDAGTKPSTEEVALQESPVKVEKTENKASTGVDISSAKILVSVGRGLGKKEGLQQLEPLVKALGAEFAGSRPVCLDYQWLGEDRWVGISGKKVSPKVYIALGISGQIQHIAGIRGSKVIMAINKDKSAPIFEECDYGIVGDMYQVVPKILALLK